ncbi:hypothetical protein [Mesobacterium pallidum]|uniref:hypothetical protein n=1 Tax=Mesobacterium pallidum TaxID=2872037 RepID=UPI001EE28C47|nr:hypothetical protein [Mesobacterium pallidum]
MPCFYRVYADRNLLLRWYHGTITPKAVLAMYDRMQVDPQLPLAQFDICNLDGIDALDAEPRELRNLVEMGASIYHARRSTFVAGVVVARSDPARFLAHHFKQALAEPFRHRFRVVESMEEALRAFDLPKDLDIAPQAVALRA